MAIVMMLMMMTMMMMMKPLGCGMLEVVGC